MFTASLSLLQLAESGWQAGVRLYAGERVTQKANRVTCALHDVLLYSFTLFILLYTYTYSMHISMPCISPMKQQAFSKFTGRANVPDPTCIWSGRWIAFQSQCVLWEFTACIEIYFSLTGWHVGKQQIYMLKSELIPKLHTAEFRLQTYAPLRWVMHMGWSSPQTKDCLLPGLFLIMPDIHWPLHPPSPIHLCTTKEHT